MRSFCQRSLLLMLVLAVGAVLQGQQSSSGQAATGGPFTPTCSSPLYPSPPPATKLDIDGECSLVGSGGAETAQNSAKNNFCAANTPEPITIEQLQKLQVQVQNDHSINFGNKNTPTRQKGPTTKRAPLQKLGEGNAVVLKGFVLKARQEGAESVNCGKNVADSPLLHDIHIAIVADKSVTNECSGVVVEASPHHRPDSWTQENVEKVAKAGAQVQVTGQLFFDSSHFPCEAGKPSSGNPARISLWEVHPVYKLEVCDGNCDVGGTWMPLDQWLAKP
jgi:hypothetical protein